MKLAAAGAFIKAVLCIPCMQAMDLKTGQQIIAVTSKTIRGLDARFTKKCNDNQTLAQANAGTVQVLTENLAQMSDGLRAHTKQVEHLSLFVGAQHKQNEEAVRNLSWSAQCAQKRLTSLEPAVRDIEVNLEATMNNLQALLNRVVRLEERDERAGKDVLSLIQMFAMEAAQRLDDIEEFTAVCTEFKDAMANLEERQAEDHEHNNKRWCTLGPWKTNVLARLIASEQARKKAEEERSALEKQVSLLNERLGLFNTRLAGFENLRRKQREKDEEHEQGGMQDLLDAVNVLADNMCSAVQEVKGQVAKDADGFVLVGAGEGEEEAA